MKDLIALIPPEHLPQLKKYLRAMMTDVNTKVVQRDIYKDQERRRERNKRTLEVLVRRTIARFRGGMHRDLALEEGTQDPPYPTLEQLDFWLKKAEKKAGIQSRQRRDAKITALRSEGLTNAVIAAKIGCSISPMPRASQLHPCRTNPPARPCVVQPDKRQGPPPLLLKLVALPLRAT